MEIPAGLVATHCGGRCGGGADAACTCAGARHALFRGSEGKSLFVGGGISSVEGAKIALAAGADPLIVEALPFLGGIWATAANPESRIQVDPVAFRPVEDAAPVAAPDAEDPFATIYPSRAAVLLRLEDHVARFGLRPRALCGVEVARFERLGVGAAGAPQGPGLVRVTFRKVAPPLPPPQEGCCACCAAAARAGEFAHDFKEVHVRTGSLTKGSHKGGDFRFAGEEGGSFKGRVVKGIANDITMAGFEGQDVVIVGLGAFAVENARRALQGRARSITVLSRRFDKLLFPELACYLLRQRLQQDAAGTQAHTEQLWADVYDVVAAAAGATGMRDVVLNPATLRKVGGLEHFVFSKGLPSMASNTLLLGAHYGLVDVREDEIARLEGGVVHTKHGRAIPCTVLVKCMGFGCDETLLDGHAVEDSYFVGGAPNMTHNLRADCVNGEGQLIGPRVAASNFLISYYEDAQEYERAIQRLNQHAPAFAEFRALQPASRFERVAQVDYFTTLELSDKLASMQDPGMRRVYAENQATRRALYEKCLPEEAFIEHDMASWDKLARHFAARTGKPVLDYPFALTGSASQGFRYKAGGGSAARL